MNEHIFIISHRRSGTHLMIDAISNNFEKYSSKFLNADLLAARFNRPEYFKEFEAGLSHAPRLIKSHMHTDMDNFFEHDKNALSLLKELTSASKKIYIYRDGRDVMTSLYFYMRNFTPEISELSFSEFLRMENDVDKKTLERSFNRVGYWVHHLEGWLAQEGTLHVSFEELKQNLGQVLDNVADFLSLERPRQVKQIIRKEPPKIGPRFVDDFLNFFFELYYKYSPRANYTSVSFRKGRSGDYKNYFNAEDFEYFDEHAGELMRKLGYF